MEIWDRPMTLKEILQNCDDDFNIECRLETNINRLRAGDDCLSKDLFGSNKFDFTECHIEGYPGGDKLIIRVNGSVEWIVAFYNDTDTDLIAEETLRNILDGGEELVKSFLDSVRVTYSNNDNIEALVKEELKSFGRIDIARFYRKYVLKIQTSDSRNRGRKICWKSMKN